MVVCHGARTMLLLRAALLALVALSSFGSATTVSAQDGSGRSSVVGRAALSWDQISSEALTNELSGAERFGPFAVLDRDHAALVGATDARSPREFRRMLSRWPQIRVLEQIDCPGTLDDRANLALGRMIRARGIDTHVPAHGSVRSGGVELFLAGKHRTAEEGAWFAVHAWRDRLGREPQDLAANAPANLAYLEYYQAMGMSPDEAQAFYALTNSAPNHTARWLTAAQMRSWVAIDPRELAHSTVPILPMVTSGQRRAS